MLRTLFLLFFSIMLFACSSFFEKEEPKEEPKGKPPSTITISMVGDTSLNTNSEGESTAIELQFYELQDDSMFLQADYTEITKDHVKALKSNFVKVYDFVLLPKQFKYIEAIELDDKTNYVAVVARFSDPEKSKWRKIMKVKNKFFEYHLLVHIQDDSVELSGVF